MTGVGRATVVRFGTNGHALPGVIAPKRVLLGVPPHLIGAVLSHRRMDQRHPRGCHSLEHKPDLHANLSQSMPTGGPCAGTFSTREVVAAGTIDTNVLDVGARVAKYQLDMSGDYIPGTAAELTHPGPSLAAGRRRPHPHSS